MMWQTAAQAILYMWFSINQSTIEQQYCENKAKPKMQCHGNCHLNKQIQKTEQPASPVNIPNWTIKLKEVAFLIPDSHLKSIIANPAHSVNYYLIEAECDGFGMKHDQPPELTS